jgi:multidrug transporter EmrE-like cation transporter
MLSILPAAVKLYRISGPAKFTAYAMLSLRLVSFLHYLRNQWIGWFSAYDKSSLLWYGLLLAFLPRLFLPFDWHGMKRIGSNNVAIISSIGPVSTILQAHYILGEAYFWEQLIGTLLVIAGILLLSWKGRKRCWKFKPLAPIFAPRPDNNAGPDAQVAKLVDALSSGGSAARCAGSNPVLGTVKQPLQQFL